MFEIKMRWPNRSDLLSLLFKYSHLLAQHPYSVLLTVVSIFVTLITLPFITHKVPDFSDPQLGFESRGTIISTRLSAWDNLVEATRTSGPLTLNPSELYHHHDRSYKIYFSDGRKKKKNRSRFNSKVWRKKKVEAAKTILKTPGNSTLVNAGNIPMHDGSDDDGDISEDEDDLDELQVDQESSISQPAAEDYFCGDPSSDYARIVLSSTLEYNLFTLDSLLTMCRIEHEILIGNAIPGDANMKYHSLCQPSRSGGCCRSWSIPNYIALISNHSSCMNITEEDVKYAMDMLRRCASLYYKHELSSDCSYSGDSIACQSSPEECTKNNWAYNIFHFLADKDFFRPTISDEKKSTPFLRYAMVFLPMACSTATLPYYSAIKDSLLMKTNGIQVDAVELGLRDNLFDKHLIEDSWLLIGVAVAIGACMWLYSSSCLIAVAAIISIPLSLGLSYTAYKYIFQISFFPFLNMIAAVISLGIGVDDAFIFCKMWKFLKEKAISKKISMFNRNIIHTEMHLNKQPTCVETNVDELVVEQNAESRCVDVSAGDMSVPLENCSDNERREELPSAALLVKDESDLMTSCESKEKELVDSPPRRGNSGDCDNEEISQEALLNKISSEEKCGVSKGGNQLEDTSFNLYYDSNHGSEEWLVCETLKQSFQSMFVTSFTTAAAFYFSYFSKVTAIRCFSIFAGTAVITNFVLMLTLFPAVVVIAERWMGQTCTNSCKIKEKMFCINAKSSTEVPKATSLLLFLHVMYSKFLKLLRNCDTDFIISKQWALIWVISLGIMAICSVVVTTHFPGLHPPNDPQFQLLYSSHLFERYQLVLRSFFNFEQEIQTENTGNGREFGLPLRFIFGVLPLDLGDPLDPASRVPRGQKASNLHLDSNFDLSSRQGQAWLLKFCQSIRSQAFFGSNSGPLLSNCFIETFQKWMSRRCIEPFELIDRTPCCETSHFPFTRKVFRKCLLRALAQLHKTPHLLFLHKGESAGPRFLKTKPHQMVAAVIEYESRVPFTTSFNSMNEFYNAVEVWMSEQMKTAPQGLKCGWFISNLYFYDLQWTLSTGVLNGVCISLGVSALTLLVFTCNLLKSSLTAFSIASATSVTLAILSLLGWSLGPVESLTLSLAVGLSADFALHYAICHHKNSVRKCKCNMISKSSRCIPSVISECWTKTVSCKSYQEDNKRDAPEVCGSSNHNGQCNDEGPFVGVPATLAAITTAVAGILMLPSSVVAYTQVGVFLIVLIATSWFYSTFFLLSLLRLFQAF